MNPLIDPSNMESIRQSTGPSSRRPTRHGEVPHPMPAMRRRLSTALLAASVATLMTGCNQMVPPSNLKAPSLSVSGLGVESITRDSLKLRVRLTARNPNTVDMPLSNLRFDVSLMGQRLVHGAVAEETFTLPAQGERDVPVVLAFAGADARDLLIRLMTKGLTEVPWELKGSARWGISPIPLAFEKHGSLGLRTVLDAVMR